MILEPPLEAGTLQRVREILRLGDNFWSEQTVAILTDMRNCYRLEKRQSTERARKRLESLAKAAEAAAGTLREVDDRGLEAWLLRKARLPEPFDIHAERSRAEAFAARARRAADSAPSPGHRTKSGKAEAIRILAMLYESHRKTRAARTDDDFVELVGYVLGLADPAKDIGAALREIG